MSWVLGEGGLSVCRGLCQYFLENLRPSLFSSCSSKMFSSSHAFIMSFQKVLYLNYDFIISLLFRVTQLGNSELSFSQNWLVRDDFPLHFSRGAGLPKFWPVFLGRGWLSGGCPERYGHKGGLLPAFLPAFYTLLVPFYCIQDNSKIFFNHRECIDIQSRLFQGFHEDDTSKIFFNHGESINIQNELF